jgi:diguanylate cyclase (GGDEF)-like protein/PAS domain S-box-containing protein
MDKPRNYKDAILDEQVRLAVKQLPTMQITSFIIAIILSFTVRNIMPRGHIVAWLMMVLLSVFGRTIFYYRFQKVPRKYLVVEYWSNVYLLLTLFSGIVWGLSAFIIFPVGHVWLTALFLIALAGLSAGTTISHSGIKLGATAWIVPVMLSYAIRCVLVGDEFGYILALFIVIFMAAIILHSLKSYESVTSSISLKFENIDLLTVAQESEERFHALAGASFEGMIVSQAGIIKDCNEQLSRMLGFSKEELLDKPLRDLVPPDEIGRVMDNITSRREAILDHDLLCKDGSRRSIEAHGITTTYGGKEYRMTAIHDITERKKASEELKRLNELLACQATTDPLTGIPNRTKFNEAFSTEILRSKRFRLPLSLIIFDIDNFKIINDTYGHNIGDGVLQYLAGLVAKVVRKNDLFARWGGEEFLIMVTNTGQHGAEMFAERLRLLIDKYKFPEVGNITCSFGVAEFAYNDTDESLINRTDQALYQAKGRGKNRVEVISAPSPGG